MMASTHGIIAITFLSLFYWIYPSFTKTLPYIYALMAVTAGSLAPDIDHPKSLISQKNLVFFYTSKAVSSVTGHRGLTHSIIAGLLFTILISIGLFFYNAIYLAPAFFFGYVAHLIADSLNPSGVKWLQPINNDFELKLDKTFVGKRITVVTGGRAESVIATIFALAFAGLVLLNLF